MTREGPNEGVERLERSFAYHLARGTWVPSAVVKLTLELPRTAAATPAARKTVSDRAGALLDEEELEIVEVLVTELMTNAVAHAGPQAGEGVVLHLAVASQRIRVELCDGGTGFDPDGLQLPRHEGGGFGLLMVDRAASRWGVASDEGNCVWFELDRQPA